jgi:type VI protein secretion system component VasK
MKINTEDLRQYMTIGFVIALLVYFIMLTILTIAFFFGWVSPEIIPRLDWWTALGIVVTLTLAILIMNFVRERTYNETQKKLIDDYNETQQRIKQAESEVENTKQLSTLSTILPM